ncbi:hypothetical protein ACRFV7_005234 [Klebsiella oxytoca]|jgi:hypothetical protein|uniref:Uncharacterized protein n=8 Tax=Klebsiella/Raoultella group TaxID=2890311 RepID=A0A7H0EVX2_KLEVA|nr:MULTISPECIES: hypothetical protein [Enterobacteriaceae]AGO88967.1 hypothetical protein pKpNDM1_00030 [Raoultella planticola]ANS55289.1 hypothetical protein [Klebsiella pneumoniae]ARD69281.1 Hypothetical protein [Raoultella ornithinolytica]ARV43098.1 hypothetical protein RJA_28600 [Klebsiella pneumoniae subsp. pneumoniae]ASI57020.1 hypothetical protein CA210_01760 [Raoultella ornithinolytica]
MSTIPQLAELGFTSDVIPVINTPAPNMTRGFERFHISYNFSSAAYGCDTTALVLDERVFFVLDGDHARDMTEAAKSHGIDGCVNVFIDRIESANRHSEHKMAIGLTSDKFGLMPTALAVIGEQNILRLLSAVTGTVQDFSANGINKD